MRRALSRCPTLALLLLAAGTLATCTFPEVTLDTNGSGGAAQTTGTDETTTLSAGGAGGNGGATGGGGMGGSEGGNGGMGGSGGSTSTSTSTDPCPVDMDGDMSVSWECGSGDDCADGDPNTHPGIADFSEAPIEGDKRPNTAEYDKNCDGTEERETPKLNCGFLNCDSSKKGFSSDVPCGMSASLGHCRSVFFIGCEFAAENPAQVKVQKCR